MITIKWHVFDKIIFNRKRQDYVYAKVQHESTRVICEKHKRLFESWYYMHCFNMKIIQKS